jgi:hypothetical protein
MWLQTITNNSKSLISFNPIDVVPSFLGLNQIFSEKTSVSKLKKHPSQGKPPYSQNPTYTPLFNSKTIIATAYSTVLNDRNKMLKTVLIKRTKKSR